MISLAAAQTSRIKKARGRQRASAERSRSERKESLWFPAFANFDEDE